MKRCVLFSNGNNFDWNTNATVRELYKLGSSIVRSAFRYDYKVRFTVYDENDLPLFRFYTLKTSRGKVARLSGLHSQYTTTGITFRDSRINNF